MVPDQELPKKLLSIVREESLANDPEIICAVSPLGTVVPLDDPTPAVS